MIDLVKTATIIRVTSSRYHRQTLLPQIGNAGQEKLAAAKVLIIGCGALGCTIADLLARAGVGFLRIVDRDLVESTNIQRQTLFDEADARNASPKAIAAASRLSAANSEIQIAPHIADVDSSNIESLSRDIDLILDGTDNVATRYLINDVSIKKNIPWIYGACVGTQGRAMFVHQNVGPCLRCIFPDAPDPTSLPTCDTAGVLGPVASLVASLQALAALRWICAGDSTNELLSVDAWTNRFHATSLIDAKRADCPACGLKRFDFLNSPTLKSSAKLCGRNAVQVRSEFSRPIDLPSIAEKLRAIGPVQQSPYLVRCELKESAGDLLLTAFTDGRVIVQGTSDPNRARAAVSRFLGA